MKKFLVIAAASAAALAALTAVAAVYTSRSSFCITCHYMQPFYDSWKASSHNKVECVECHFAPGFKNKIHGKMMGLVQLVKYASLTYRKSRPWAEISDESCLRAGCHETRLLQGKVVFKEGVVFDHAPHLGDLKRGKKLRCTSCHSQIVQGNHMVVTEATCFLCHFKPMDGQMPKAAECTLCHTRELMEQRRAQGQMRYDHSTVLKHTLACTNCHSHTIVGDGPVHRQNCYQCHWDTARLDKYGDTALMHAKHITENKIECIRCHLGIEHAIHPPASTSVAECQTCHPRHHEEKIELFTGLGGVGVVSRPNRMLEIGLNCRGCHISHGIMEAGGAPKAFYASPRSCDTCHGRGFVTMLKTWQQHSRDRVAALRGSLATVTAADTARGNRQRAALDGARKNLRIVEKGNIVHNVRYATDLLEAARNTIAASAKALNVSVALPPPGLPPKEGISQCTGCHFYLDKVAPEVAGLAYSHKNHVERGLECQRCHSIARKHGELIINKEGCAACHHKKAVKKRCIGCHVLQDKVIQGTWDILDQPGIKSESFPCTDCHKLKGKKQSPQACADCHKKPEYADKMLKWSADTEKALNDIHASAAAARTAGISPGQEQQLKRAEAFAAGIRADGSGGVHNPKAIKKAAKEYIKAIAAMLPATAETSGAAQPKKAE